MSLMNKEANELMEKNMDANGAWFQINVDLV